MISVLTFWISYFFTYFLVLTFFSLSNTLLCSMLFLSASGMFRMMLCILLNVLPYSCFVKKSLSMFVVGQNATLTSPFISCLLQSSTVHLCGMFSLNLRICHFLLVISCSCYLGILSWLVVSCFFILVYFHGWYRVSLCGFSCLGVPCMNCQPTSVDCHPLL